VVDRMSRWTSAASTLGIGVGQNRKIVESSLIQGGFDEQKVYRSAQSQGTPRAC